MAWLDDLVLAAYFLLGQITEVVLLLQAIVS